jgi:hypothetical protein
VTDANGQACDSFDSLGYCPGDDPTPMQNWCAGNGYSDFQAVQADMSQLGTDSSNNDLLSVEADGASLFHHASVAGLNLPPGTKTQKLDYGLYMGYLMVGGSKLTTGDISGADSSLSKSTQFTKVVANLTNQCA